MSLPANSKASQRATAIAKGSLARTRRKKNGYRANRHIVFKCYYHVTFCPKYRRKLLLGVAATKLDQLIRQVCGEFRAEVVELAIQPDHVHFLVALDPQFGIARLVRIAKGRTSRILRLEFPQLKHRMPSLWTSSYSVTTTTGGAALEVVRKYVRKLATEAE